jgi:hypothetical protein
MKPALQLRIQSQLALTPQLQQAIKLLQLSSVELELELNQALESNPLLDIDEEEAEDDRADDFVPPEHTLSAPVDSSSPEQSDVRDETPDFDDFPLDLGEDRRGQPVTGDIAYGEPEAIAVTVREVEVAGERAGRTRYRMKIDRRRRDGRTCLEERRLPRLDQADLVRPGGDLVSRESIGRTFDRRGEGRFAGTYET